MMEDILEITEGWTSPIDYDLEYQQNGVWESFNATGMTAGMTLRDNTGTLVVPTGTVSWAIAASSRIRFTPAAADLQNLKSPYKLHWKVTSGTEVAYFPQGTPILVRVFKP